jgi:hypothetical protein
MLKYSAASANICNSTGEASAVISGSIMLTSVPFEVQGGEIHPKLAWWMRDNWEIILVRARVTGDVPPVYTGKKRIDSSGVNE